MENTEDRARAAELALQGTGDDRVATMLGVAAVCANEGDVKKACISLANAILAILWPTIDREDQLAFAKNPVMEPFFASFSGHYETSVVTVLANMITYIAIGQEGQDAFLRMHEMRERYTKGAGK
jgi:hypothetical protein